MIPFDFFFFLSTMKKGGRLRTLRLDHTRESNSEDISLLSKRNARLNSCERRGSFVFSLRSAKTKIYIVQKDSPKSHRSVPFVP